MKDDIIYLSLRYTVTIRIEDRTSGTSGEWASITAFVTVENDAQRLTAHVSVFGNRSEADDLRIKAVLNALDRARRQVEALKSCD